MPLALKQILFTSEPGRTRRAILNTGEAGCHDRVLAMGEMASIRVALPGGTFHRPDSRSGP
jgi:hypothetical protein